MCVCVCVCVICEPFISLIIKADLLLCVCVCVYVRVGKRKKGRQIISDCVYKQMLSPVYVYGLSVDCRPSKKTPWFNITSLTLPSRQLPCAIIIFPSSIYPSVSRHLSFFLSFFLSNLSKYTLIHSYIDTHTQTRLRTQFCRAKAT